MGRASGAGTLARTFLRGEHERGRAVAHLKVDISAAGDERCEGTFVAVLCRVHERRRAGLAREIDRRAAHQQRLKERHAASEATAAAGSRASAAPDRRSKRGARRLDATPMLRRIASVARRTGGKSVVAWFPHDKPKRGSGGGAPRLPDKAVLVSRGVFARVLGERDCALAPFEMRLVCDAVFLEAPNADGLVDIRALDEMIERDVLPGPNANSARDGAVAAALPSSAAPLADSGRSAAMRGLKRAGYSVEELYEAGYSVPEMEAAGFGPDDTAQFGPAKVEMSFDHLDRSAVQLAREYRGGESIVQDEGPGTDTVKRAVEAMEAGDRISVVIKSDSCPRCRNYMATLETLKNEADDTLGAVHIVDAEKDTKAAVGGIVAQGMSSYFGLPHTVVIDRTAKHYYTVVSFDGNPPKEMLGDAVAGGFELKVELLYASKFGLVDVARLLLDRGASVNQASKSGASPLLCASSFGHTEVARLLLDRGADKNQMDRYGVSPLFVACQNGHAGVAQLLLDRGASARKAWNNRAPPQLALDVRDAVGFLTGLAASHGHHEIERLLKAWLKTVGE